MAEKLVNKRIKGITKDGEEYEAIVVAIDFEKGITIDALEPEILSELGYDMGKDNHMVCLNREHDYLGGTWMEHFKSIVKQIQSGTYDARETLAYKTIGNLGSLTPCAFD